MNEATNWKEIELDGTPYYIRRIDWTHLFLTPDKERPGIAYHIAQITYPIRHSDEIVAAFQDCRSPL